MVPRFWIVTDSEARRLIDAEPFRKPLAGLPPDDRMAVARLAVESWRRQRSTGRGAKRSLAKCIANALRNYQQWRDERPDDYQLWRDVLKGDTPTRDADRPGATRTTTTAGIGPIAMLTATSIKPCNVWATFALDAQGRTFWLDHVASLEDARDRFHRHFAPDDAVEPIRWGFVPLDGKGTPDESRLVWAEKSSD